jgi:ubiquinone biosynthesis accessory factor UbiJ
MNLEDLIAPVLQTALNAYLSLDREAAKRLKAISGKIIALELTGPNITLLARPVVDTIQIRAHTGAEPDVVISGSPLALARLGLSKDMAGGLPKGGIEIRGDAEVGRVFREVLTMVEIDWEELLAARIGDIPAHQTGNVIRGLTAGLASAIDKLRMDLSEYLQEESRIVPTRIEVEQFMDEVDLLRGEVDRLEARIERLTGLQGSQINSRTR